MALDKNKNGDMTVSHKELPNGQGIGRLSVQEMLIHGIGYVPYDSFSGIHTGLKLEQHVP